MRNRNDPTRVTEQPALTTSSGRVWMVVGTVLAVVCAGVLVALIRVQQSVALIGVVLVVLLYAGMWVVRVNVKNQRNRLLTLAILFGAITAVTLVSVLVIAAAAAVPIRQ